MSELHMDAADRRLIAALSENARQSWTALGGVVNLSPSAAQRRVERLLEAGVIRRFTLDLDPARIGQSVRAFIQVKVERQKLDVARAFRARILAYPEVRAAFKLSGSVDYLIEIGVRDIAHLSDFIDRDLLALDGVVDASSAIVLETLGELGE